MKYCKDCKWFRLATGHTTPAAQMEYALCACPKAECDPVSGEPKIAYCAIQRLTMTIPTVCSLDAKWFEPKEATP